MMTQFMLTIAGKKYPAYPVHDPNTLVLQGFQVLPPGPNLIIPAAGFTPQ